MPHSRIRIGDLIFARCPRCHKGSISRGFFRLNPRCPVCDCDFYPEPGYYLGAMMVSYLASAMLMVPSILALKLSGMELGFAFFILPLLQFAILAPVILHYSRVLWLHLEFSLTGRLDGSQEPESRGGKPKKYRENSRSGNP